MEIKAQLLDLVMRDEDYVLYHGDQPLLTPGGREVASPTARILKQLLFELSMNQGSSLRSVNTYSLFSLQLDFLAQGEDPFEHNFDSIAAQDPFIQLKEGNKKQSQVFDPLQAQNLFEKNPAMLPVIFWGVSGLLVSFNNFLAVNHTSGPGIYDPSGKMITSVIRDVYLKYEKYEKTVINALSLVHGSGIVLPLLLVGRYVNASEYVNGLMAVSLQRNKEFVTLADIESILKNIFDVTGKIRGEIDPYTFFTERFREARNAIEYLLCFKEVKKEGAESLITMGESNDVEFKSTLRWDLKAGKTSQHVERAVLKTISAFMNSGGGSLLIGVRDDGSIEGIESDRLPNEDKFLLHFWTLVRTAFGKDVSPYLKTRLEKADGKTICIVKCFRSQRPVFLKQPGFEEEFFIRVGPSSNALAVSEALKYIADHFSEK
ncbi:MAG: ATP-binding protein [bacterium]